MHRLYVNAMPFYNAELEHVWSLEYTGVLQPNLHGYQGMAG